MRKIFPFQSVINHEKRICLFNHLGLCPCPPVFDSFEFKKIYRKNIQNLIKFLQGKKQQVIKNLEKERDALSKKEKYEEAKLVQRQINAILYITRPMHNAIEYEHNPNLSDDLRKNEIDQLVKKLQINGVEIYKLDRIECYDISNTSGTNATGSMVVFTNGEKDTSQYRRFKIKLTQMPNDFAMIQEVLNRRLKHIEWPFPDLIIVDGGKGQISSAQKILNGHRLSIPLIGLAKREEEIVIPVATRPGLARLQGQALKHSFIILNLPKDSISLHLLMRIRNEAHRFAITYHRKLRSKLFS